MLLSTRSHQLKKLVSNQSPYSTDSMGIVQYVTLDSIFSSLLYLLFTSFIKIKKKKKKFYKFINILFKKESFSFKLWKDINTGKKTPWKYNI